MRSPLEVRICSSYLLEDSSSSILHIAVGPQPIWVHCVYDEDDLFQKVLGTLESCSLIVITPLFGMFSGHEGTIPKIIMINFVHFQTISKKKTTVIN